MADVTWQYDPWQRVFSLLLESDGRPFSVDMPPEGVQQLIGILKQALEAAGVADMALAVAVVENPLLALGPVLWQAPETGKPVAPGEEPA